MNVCLNCGERVYSLGCVNCNEEAYIAEQEALTVEPSPSLKEPAGPIAKVRVAG